MPTSVVKGANAAVIVPQDDQRIFANLQSEVIAAYSHFAVMTCEQPFPVPDHIQIELVNSWIAVKFARQRGFTISVPKAIHHCGMHLESVPVIQTSHIRQFHAKTLHMKNPELEHAAAQQ